MPAAADVDGRRDVDGRTRVTVTVCRDQRGLSVVDKKGKPVTAKAAQFPDFLQNTYDMRRAEGEDLQGLRDRR